MEKSPFFDGIREELEARGEARGKSEGQMEILSVLLETKFGKVPEELKEHLKALKDQGKIEQAVRKAVSAETIEEYMA